MTEGNHAPRFGDRIADAVAARGSQLVLGLDPNPTQLWPAATELGPGARSARDVREAAARAVAVHCRLALEATAPDCVAAKLQVACFERLGAPGWAALEEVIAHARECGLLVFADAKRGDIDVTAAAYAHAYFGTTSTPFGPVEGLAVDALTVNPLLGADSLAPLVTSARARGGGLFALVHTSNPGAADVQERRLADGRTVSERLAELVAELGEGGIGASGLADVGAVIGATTPAWIASLREQLPRAPFLLPGVGAQGGAIDALGAAFAAGPAGGLITVSRGIIGAHLRTGGDPAEAARAEAGRLRQAAWALAERVAARGVTPPRASSRPRAKAN